jgi:hypothetical protein
MVANSPRRWIARWLKRWLIWRKLGWIDGQQLAWWMDTKFRNIV